MILYSRLDPGQPKLKIDILFMFISCVGIAASVFIVSWVVIDSNVVLGAVVVSSLELIHLYFSYTSFSLCSSSNFPPQYKNNRNDDGADDEDDTNDDSMFSDGVRRIYLSFLTDFI